MNDKSKQPTLLTVCGMSAVISYILCHSPHDHSVGIYVILILQQRRLTHLDGESPAEERTHSKHTTNISDQAV